MFESKFILLYDLYFLVNRGGDRALADAYFVFAPAYNFQIQQNHIGLIRAANESRRAEPGLALARLMKIRVESSRAHKTL
jgi:hypothetical protein